MAGQMTNTDFKDIATKQQV